MKTIFYVLISFVAIQKNVETIRPFWNIAHMVNNIDQITEYLDEGANAIETDITFDTDGTAKFTYHGFPCDCFRYCWYSSLVPFFFVEVRKLTMPGSFKYREDFVLLVLDAKVSSLSEEAKIFAGKDLAEKMIIYLWQRGKAKTKIWILLSIPYIKDISFVRSFREKLKKEGYSQWESQIGWDISFLDEVDKIENTWKSIGINSSIWQSDGITNCVHKSLDKIKLLIKLRDSKTKPSYISKVYLWTADKESALRNALRLGLDAIMTNKPKRLLTLLNEDQFSCTYRLATIDANPWTKETIKSDLSDEC